MGPGKKMTKTLAKVKKKRDPNTFTRNYNAATGITHEFIQDDAGNSITPGYDFEKASQYEANAIKKHGSLEASRKAYNSIGGPQMKSGSAIYAKLSASCKAAAKRKFKVYPSAYANIWASKQQKKGKC
tara:strand:+ start:2671 stop:3054 length:384 start_codon:yes stop_codon:yes gene_type:complete